MSKAETNGADSALQHDMAPRNGLQSMLVTRMLAWPRRLKQLALILADVGTLAIAAWAAFALRLGRFDVPYSLVQVEQIVLAVVVTLPAFVAFGLYRTMIRFLPEHALWQIAKGMAVGAFAWVAVTYMLQFAVGDGLPRSVPLIYAALGTIFIAANRFAARRLLGGGAPAAQAQDKLLIVGADAAGAEFAQALRRHNREQPVAFIDFDPKLQGRDVGGVRVHPPASLVPLVEQHNIRNVVISLQAVESAGRQEVVAALRDRKVRIRALPNLAEIVRGRYEVQQAREADIDDLLGRSSVPPDPALLRAMIEDKVILVTGAGGSIGSELCRLVAGLSPRRLVLLEASEFALYQIERELHDRLGERLLPVLGSVSDVALVRRVMASERPQVVFHAAAHKHVPLVESNALEGIRNNVLGTHALVNAAFEHGVEAFVLISTDKAVRPSNVMGATKRWAELLVKQKAAEAAQSGTGQRFTAVRFGNVLGSNGSVVPLFREQIRAGGPMTLTDPDMTRYFMSIHEAAELIVQAGALAEGGDTFVLDMGQPIRIRDLAENMVALAGLTVRSETNPQGDIELVTIGARVGEKVHEELFYSEGSVSKTAHPKIMVSREQTDEGAVRARLPDLAAALEHNDERRAREVLFDLTASSTEP